jgi:hypothetical protein
VHLCDPNVTRQLEATLARFPGVNVTVHRERSVDLLAGDAAFDFVFVDGDHTEEAGKAEAALLLAANVPAVMVHDTTDGAGRVRRGRTTSSGLSWRRATREGRPGAAEPRHVLRDERRLTTWQSRARWLFSSPTRSVRVAADLVAQLDNFANAVLNEWAAMGGATAVFPNTVGNMVQDGAAPNGVDATGGDGRPVVDRGDGEQPHHPPDRAAERVRDDGPGARGGGRPQHVLQVAVNTTRG